MDIYQLDYFIKIVESGGNLTLAAKKANVSQSSLSQLITNFEKEEDIELFYRKNGRLKELTPSGEKYYAYALRVRKIHFEMHEMIRRDSLKKKGRIRIGIPSLILRIYFTTFFTKFIVKNDDVKIEIVEAGSHKLHQLLLQGELDLAVLIHPTYLNKEKFEEFTLIIDEIGAFMSINHPLAKKKTLNWLEIENYPLATFNRDFSSNKLIVERLRQEGISKEMKFTSSSWDFLTAVTKESTAIALLPSPIKYQLDKEVKMVPFEDPIPFEILLTRPVKENYESLEKYVKGAILTCFANRKPML
ncbi:LysR family transcriptional regulator [Vagococcus fluvialis]|uniref:LysR family transcriptional regulator n=1 Tax=Vagococcus fluvialis TaxID=2738 RepID=UPI0014331159|nr:LysR family transcriptional regulator [Vagococcus fluvialis]NKC59392.1 LysR family transcriptional regulator [Vagococcus fluvialis]NKD50212.1 LysR family transcriptional regulator [Vagococcus fluvialis]UDM74367.1 LysR family transcriptional regulator [Vagococcus fluvialis]WNF90365.1 LysR family transcriptional regulator [Vagococcus fluvialis]